MIKPKPGFYSHYKRNSKKGPYDHIYEMIGIARHTENKTYTVLYRPLYANDWMSPADYQSRPLEMFLGKIKINGKTLPRFRRITDKKLVRKLEIVRNKMYKKF